MTDIKICDELLSKIRSDICAIHDNDIDIKNYDMKSVIYGMLIVADRIKEYKDCQPTQVENPLDNMIKFVEGDEEV